MESKEFNVADTPPDANSEANVWSGGAVADGGLAVKELADARAAARCVTWGATFTLLLKRFVLLQTNSHEIASRGVKGAFGGAGKVSVDPVVKIHRNE